MGEGSIFPRSSQSLSWMVDADSETMGDSGHSPMFFSEGALSSECQPAAEEANAYLFISYHVVLQISTHRLPVEWPLV